MGDLEELVHELRQTYSTDKTKNLKWRKSQLRSLLKMYEEQKEVFVSALKCDLGKPRQESLLMEIQYNINVTIEILSKIDSWVKNESADKSLVTILDKVYCHYDPYGVVLIISPWNYPLQLTLSPLAGAIAAGNCCVIKPSELSPAVGQALYDLVPKYLDNDCFKVVLGDVPFVTKLLSIRFDYIFFTGSPAVGRIIANAGAKYLTPMTLELGGKCPVYIHSDIASDPKALKIAVKRIVWGKMANAGQTCVAPDYIICHRDVAAQFQECIKIVYREFYSEDTEYKFIGRIINEQHFKRLKTIIDEMPDDKCILKGPCVSTERLIGLHVYTNVEESDSAMQSEIFGPILPIVKVNDCNEAIEMINKGSKPLSLYIISKRSEIEKSFVQRTSSGSVCINDLLVQLSVDSLPFGGVGESGYGRYHGKYSFECFSHKKSVLGRDLGAFGEKIGSFRYPPYSDSKSNLGSKVIKPISLPGLGFIKYCVASLFGLVLGLSYHALARYVNGS